MQNHGYGTSYGPATPKFGFTNLEHHAVVLRLGTDAEAVGRNLERGIPSIREILEQHPTVTGEDGRTWHRWEEGGFEATHSIELGTGEYLLVVRIPYLKPGATPLAKQEGLLGKLEQLLGRGGQR